MSSQPDVPSPREADINIYLATEQSNPLIAALPPNSDPFTYLTILEYNLDKSQLDLLHDILQDRDLTANIGWDLVHLLLPLLPESEKCLEDIAFLGNPRETIMSVVAALNSLCQNEAADADDDDSTSSERGVQDVQGDSAGDAKAVLPTEAGGQVMLIGQFHSLLHMLCILHPRIKTKRPSAFLKESLKAVVKAFAALQDKFGPSDFTGPKVDGKPGSTFEQPSDRLQACIRSILMVINTLSGSNRPRLPPRPGQFPVPQVATREAAPDPEDSQETVHPKEAALQLLILQSFVTQVTEIYVRSLKDFNMAVPGLAWSERYFEHRNCHRRGPHEYTFPNTFGQGSNIELAEATMSQWMFPALQDLGFSYDTLIIDLCAEVDPEENMQSMFQIPEFPASLSGALYILAWRACTTMLKDHPVSFSVNIPHEHSLLTSLFFRNPVHGVDVDAVLLLGYAALKSHGVGDWETNAEFDQYLRTLMDMAAHCSFPRVATLLSEFISNVLHAYPSSDFRFDFILETLENCPYAGFKGAAVLWLKDEIYAAFNLARTRNRLYDERRSTQTNSLDSPNVFTHPATLAAAAPFLFAKPDPSETDGVPLDKKAFIWQASINLYYALSTTEILYNTLEVRDLYETFKIEDDFIGTLRRLVDESKDSAPTGSSQHDNYELYLALIDDALTRISNSKA